MWPRPLPFSENATMSTAPCTQPSPPFPAMTGGVEDANKLMHRVVCAGVPNEVDVYEDEEMVVSIRGGGSDQGHMPEAVCSANGLIPTQVVSRSGLIDDGSTLSGSTRHSAFASSTMSAGVSSARSAPDSSISPSENFRPVSYKLLPNNIKDLNEAYILKFKSHWKEVYPELDPINEPNDMKTLMERATALYSQVKSQLHKAAYPALMKLCVRHGLTVPGGTKESPKAVDDIFHAALQGEYSHEWLQKAEDVFISFLGKNKDCWVNTAQQRVQEQYKIILVRTGSESKHFFQGIAHHIFNNTRLQQLRRHMKKAFRMCLYQRGTKKIAKIPGQKPVKSRVSINGTEYLLVQYVDDDDATVGEAFKAPVARAIEKGWSKDKIVAMVGKIIDDANGKKSEGEVNTKSLAIIFTCQSANCRRLLSYCLLHPLCAISICTLFCT